MFTRSSLLVLTAAGLLLAGLNAAENNPEKTRKLVAVLQSNASFFDKARACQQLGEFGGREAVPALAALLGDEHLSAYARSGLEGIPDPSAAEALRTAAATLKGDRLVGAINSLGVLRDAQAVGLLRKLAGNPDAAVVKAAVLALGCISTDESILTLRQTLSDGSPAVRAEAASACLLAAEKKLADGHAETAVALYDAVRQANVSLLLRAAATRGAIVARKENGAPLLIEQLRSSDRIMRHTALLAIREIPSDTLANALNAEVNWASAELQAQLLVAFVDCHNAQSLQVLRTKAASNDAEVREAALATLGRIGAAAEAEVLLKAVAADRNTAESATALDSLARMRGPAIDGRIVQALVSATDPGSRIRLIRLVESRGMTNAAGELLQQAGFPDGRVGVAALRALKSLAGSGELLPLIALTKASSDDAVREAAENAVVGACSRLDNVAPGGDAVLAELKQTTDPILKNCWVRILVSLGYAKALPALLAVVNDTNEAVAANAIDQLARWPNPAPMETLFSVIQANASPAQRKRALTSAIRLATAAAEEQQRPEAILVKWFQQASQAASSVEERRSIISGLGRVKHIESFRLLAPYLDDARLRNEAALAIVQIAPALRSDDSAALKKSLEKIVATATVPDVRSRAAKITGTIPSPVKQTPLFDGRSLAGWEGNTNVWRVRDGAIVGGSMNGNPRNEFLATLRRYTNFLLRLEYKLVGSEGFVNGGVQFRSVRVKQPPNEMSGFQADIGAGYSGCLYDESRRNKFLARPTDELVKLLERPGEWNRYEVRCAGPRIQITLNGEKTVDYTETDASVPQAGLIALQIHGNCKAEISFRSLTIEEFAQP